MARTDVEFLGDDGRALTAADEDVVEWGRRGVPRLVGALAVVAVLGVASAVLVGTHQGRTHAAPQPTLAPRPIGASIAPVVGLPLGGIVPLDGGAAAVDVAVAGNHLYVLQTDRISIFDAHTFTRVISQPLARPVAAGHARLVLDMVDASGWLVTVGATPSVITSFDARTLDMTDSATFAGSIQRTTALDGALYFSAAGGVYRYVAPDTAPALVRRADSGVALAADREHDRLVLYLPDLPAKIAEITPGGQLVRSESIDIVGGDVAVTGSTIWLTGTDANGAVVRMLDPRTLVPGPNLDIRLQLSPGAVIAASGGQSLWLRSSGANRDVLYCRDVAGGPLASWWTLPGRIASDNGVAFVADQGAVRSINLFSGCSG